jgi:hypothetical protein
VIIPQWSDSFPSYRYVYRFFNAQIGFESETDQYIYPDSGIVFVRTVYINAVAGDPSTRKFVETRLVMNKGTEWYWFNYKWNDEQTDAFLVKDFKNVDTTYTVSRGGSTQEIKWRAQDQYGCAQCHGQPRRVNGFYTAEINRPTLHDPGLNQIDHFFSMGLFAGGAPPEPVDSMPRWVYEPHSNDSLTRLHSLAGYMATQCSPCHGTRGHVEAMVMNFDFYDMQFKMNGLFDLIDGSATSTISRCYNVKALFSGDPNASTIYNRQSVRPGSITDYNPSSGQMPPSTTYYPDTVALNMLADWICSLDTVWCNAGLSSRQVTGNDTLYIIDTDSILWESNKRDAIRPDTIVMSPADTLVIDSIESDFTKCPVIIPTLPQ